MNIHPLAIRPSGLPTPGPGAKLAAGPGPSTVQARPATGEAAPTGKGRATPPATGKKVAKAASQAVGTIVGAVGGFTLALVPAAILTAAGGGGAGAVGLAIAGVLLGGTFGRNVGVDLAERLRGGARALTDPTLRTFFGALVGGLIGAGGGFYVGALASGALSIGGMGLVAPAMAMTGGVFALVGADLFTAKPKVPPRP